MLKDKIISAVESQAVMGNKKPNLVIIDEIDGVNAGGGDQVRLFQYSCFCIVLYTIISASFYLYSFTMQTRLLSKC